MTRALNLNYAPFIQATWNDAAKKGSETDPFLPEFVEKFHDKFKDVLVAGAKGELTKPYTDGIARLMYQLSGPIVHELGKALDSGATFAALGLPSKWQLGLLATVSWHYRLLKRCTASTNTPTCSGFISGDMPWPRLKTWPSREPPLPCA